MAQASKTKPMAVNVTEYIDALDNEQQRADGHVLLKLMKKVTKANDILWGNSIISFGEYHYDD